jgi:mannose-6-phosphate isomerase-like protein (cupin superfamily)
MDTSRRLSADADAIAPDTMEVRLLATGVKGSMAHFTLPAHAIGAAVVHAELEELWFCLSGRGEMWLSRSHDPHEAAMVIEAGVSFCIPVGVSFQLANTSNEPLAFVAVTMPPWPGDRAAQRVTGPWLPA